MNLGMSSSQVTGSLHDFGMYGSIFQVLLDWWSFMLAPFHAFSWRLQTYFVFFSVGPNSIQSEAHASPQVYERFTPGLVSALQMF